MIEPNVISLGDISQLVGSLGFPIAVTWFLLQKGSQIVTGITSAINDMRVAIDRLGDRLEALEKERAQK